MMIYGNFNPMFKAGQIPHKKDYACQWQQEAFKILDLRTVIVIQED
jgi:hypothetical protein